jgi:hypothetical protein
MRQTIRTDDDDPDAQEDDVRAEQNNNKVTTYRKRKQRRVLRSRAYEIEDMVNYKRELVLLYMPFRNEAVDILDRNKFMELYEQHEASIMSKRQEHHMNINIEQLMEELKTLCDFKDAERTDEVSDNLTTASKVRDDNTDDIYEIPTCSGISVVRKREGVMSKQHFNDAMKTMNLEQVAFLNQIIRTLHTSEEEPIQTFFSGPAGDGKTYTLKMVMEIFNRYSQKHNSLRNAYVACASTGKAASAFHGTTVHSAFRILAMRTADRPLACELEQTYRGRYVQWSGLRYN